MAYLTLEQITQDTISLLSQATGVGVQRYSQPRIELLVNLCFEMLIIREWWPAYMQWFLATLDGSTGVVTDDISSITRYQDVRAVFPSGSDVPLPELPTTVNPYELPAGQLMFISSNEAASSSKVFKVWSQTATGQVAIHARLMPARFVSNNIIKFDSLALEYGAAWAYAEDDGTNPGASQKFQTLFENRVKDIEAEVQHKPISLDGRGVRFPNYWWVR